VAAVVYGTETAAAQGAPAAVAGQWALEESEVEVLEAPED
jgi:hypothetical protein